MNRYVKGLIMVGAVCTALISIAGAWHLLGGDTPAWSSDVRKMDARQTETAVDVYSRAISDDTILKAQIPDQRTKALIDDRIKMNEEKLKRAQDRKIELGK